MQTTSCVTRIVEIIQQTTLKIAGIEEDLTGRSIPLLGNAGGFSLVSFQGYQIAVDIPLARSFAEELRRLILEEHPLCHLLDNGFTDFIPLTVSVFDDVETISRFYTLGIVLSLWDKTILMGIFRDMIVASELNAIPSLN